MKEKLRKSVASSNFWNNASTIASLATLIVLISFVKDPDSVKDMVLAFMASSGFHNAGNVMSHMNKN